MNNEEGYRAFPSEIINPKKVEYISKEDFDKISKQQMQEAPSVCAGHKGTTIWYIENEGFIIQVQFDNKPDVYAPSICTVTPTFGMDMIDGMFAQDIEECILYRELGRPTDRLDIFNEEDSVSMDTYLRDRGVVE